MADEKAPVAKKGEGFDKDLIRELADLLSETNLSEIEIETGGKRVRVARTINAVTHIAADAPRKERELGDRASAETAHRPGTVTSPMVGTAYRSPEPGVAPFVEAGARVALGQTILIIEAMKTMNHIPAPYAGTVIAILVEDGQPVEYAEPLAIIEKG